MNFFQQPVQAVFDRLYQDVMVLTEYLNQDKYRIKALLRRLRREHTLASHSVNTGVMGLWLYLKGHDWQYQRRDLDRAALGLFLHDAGMCKIPPFILEKSRISLEERSKIAQHPLIGVRIVQKLGLTFSEMGHAVMEHHERLDGSGYPRKLSAQQISGFGKLVAVADSFCAMIAKRPHAEAMEPAQAAGALAADERRYDRRLAKIVEAAYLTGQF